jgi:ketosteroid isomerase-like protein
MSEENVKLTYRGLDAYNRRDVESLLATLDPEVEWTTAFPALLGGDATVYRGHEGIREMFRDFDDVLDEIHVEYSEVRDLGDRVFAIGRIRTRGKASGAATESPFAAVTDVRNGKSVRVRTYLDPQEALAAAGLSE